MCEIVLFAFCFLTGRGKFELTRKQEKSADRSNKIFHYLLAAPTTFSAPLAPLIYLPVHRYLFSFSIQLNFH